MEGAAVRPTVIEGDVVQVNGSDLDVAGQGALPLQAAAEVLMEDVGSGVVIAEDLSKCTVKETNKKNKQTSKKKYLQ